MQKKSGRRLSSGNKSAHHCSSICSAQRRKGRPQVQDHSQKEIRVYYRQRYLLNRCLQEPLRIGHCLRDAIPQSQSWGPCRSNPRLYRSCWGRKKGPQIHPQIHRPSMIHTQSIPMTEISKNIPLIIITSWISLIILFCSFCTVEN